MGKQRRREEAAAAAEATVPTASPLRRVALPLGLAAAVVVAFLPVLRAGFVNWDDDTNFLRNPFYRGLGLQQLTWMFTTFHMGHYQPLAWLTLGVDYLFWGMDPTGYHLTSLLLHAANTVLAYLFFKALLRRVRGEEPGLDLAAAAGALFYGLHPLRVESVAWVTERRDVLCGFFLLLSLLAYLRMERDGAHRGRWLALSCAAFAASLLSKALGIMLPFVLLVLDVYPLGRYVPGSRKRVLLEKLPYLALAIADGLVMIAAMTHIRQVRAAGEYALGERILQGGYGLWFYAWKTVWPADLHAVYALGDQVSLWRAEYTLPLLGSLAVTGALIAARRRWPAGLAAWTAYALLLAPVLGFVVKGYQRAADRYSYLSCLPLSLLVAGALAALGAAERGGRISAPAGRTVRGGAAAALLLLGFLTWRQSGTWKDSLTLFDRVLTYEQRADLPYVNRGSARRERGDVGGALEDYEAALRVNPRSVDALTNRGEIRQGRGEFDGALADYAEVLKIDAAVFEVYNNRASLKSARKDWDGALADAEQALRLKDWEPEPYAIRGRARQGKGDLDGALADFDTALRVANPSWPHRKTVEAMRDRARSLKAAPR